MGQNLIGEVLPDHQKAQNAVESALTALGQAMDFAGKVILDSKKRYDELQLAPDDLESLDQMVNMSNRLTQSGMQLGKLVDLVYRVSEFSQGRADSRPDMQMSQRKFLEGMSDELLAQVKSEVERELETIEANVGGKREGMLQ